MLHQALLNDPNIEDAYCITPEAIADTATEATWGLLASMYTLEGHKHYRQHPHLVEALATHQDPAVRLAVALNPSFALATRGDDEHRLIAHLNDLHTDGFNVIPKVHTFLGLTNSFPRSKRPKRNEPEPSAAAPPQKAPVTAVDASGRAFELTDQQRAILAHKPTSSLVVTAAAGSGKTSTLVEYARAWPQHKFLYLAFNAAIKKEAEQVMPKNVTVMTTHGLANQSLGISNIKNGRLAKFISRDDVKEAAKRAGIDTNLNSIMLRGVTHALNRFIVSDDKTVQFKHLLGMHWGTKDNEPPRAAFHVTKLIIEELMNFLKGDRPYTHDMYLKHFASHYHQLDGKYAAIMVDEGQDTNPAFLGFLKRLKTPVMLVGDSYQAIYGFRGAIDAMSQFPGIRRQLTRSWRFGENLAATANYILQHTSDPPSYSIQGNPTRTTRIHRGVANEGLVLARTNAGLFQHLTGVNVPFYIEGGYQTFSGEIEHAIKLFESDGDYTAGPLPYKNWDDLVIASEDHEPTAMRLYELLDNHTPEDLRWHLNRLATLAKSTPAAAQLHLATAHKAKGLEAPTATILSDFHSLRRRADLKEWLQRENIWTPETRIAFDQEIHLLYVAATRAKDHLYVADQDLHFELTRHRLAPPEEKPERRRNDA